MTSVTTQHPPVSILNVADKNPIFLPNGLFMSTLSLKNIFNQPNEFDIQLLKNFLNKNYLTYGHLIYQNSPVTLYNLLGKTTQFCIHDGKEIIGFIGRTQVSINISQKKYNGVEIGFLSIDPKYRNKKLAHTLIRKVTKEEVDTRNPIAIFVANPKLVSKHFSEVLCSFKIYIRYFNAGKYRKLGFLKDKIVHENITDLNKKFPFQIRELRPNEIKKYHSDYMQYLRKKYDVYYDYDFQTFQDFFVNKSKIRTYCIYNDDKILDYISIEVVLNKNHQGEILTTGKLFAYTNNVVNIEMVLDFFTVVCYQLGMDSAMYQTYGEMSKIQQPPTGYSFTSNINMFLQNCKLNQKIPVDKVCISYYY